VTVVVLASISALATAPAVLVTLLAALILLSLRAVTQIFGLPLAVRVSILLNGAIAVLACLFIVLVGVRFVTVG